MCKFDLAHILYFSHATTVYVTGHMSTCRLDFDVLMSSVDDLINTIINGFKLFSIVHVCNLLISDGAV